MRKFVFALFSVLVFLGQAYAYNLRDTGPAGGIIFCTKPDYFPNTDWTYLEASTVDQSYGVQWNLNNDYTVVGQTSTYLGKGKDNTNKIVEKLGNSNYAAKLCSDLVLGGYDDWYLPSKDELNCMYENLYKLGLGNFDSYNYWTSSEDSDFAVWAQAFRDGSMEVHDKSYPHNVRCIRSF